jgi:hypothetical protein
VLLDNAALGVGSGVHASNERASGLAFAQYIRQHTTKAHPTYCDRQGF